jgi:hypothetical protein
VSEHGVGGEHGRMMLDESNMYVHMEGEFLSQEATGDGHGHDYN